MDLPNILSTIAIVAAIGSVVVTIWATRISKKSLQHAIDVQVRIDQKEFERLRSELLNQISDSRSILNKTRIEIGTLQANFQAEPSIVQDRMRKYISLFTDYLPKIEKSIQQCDQQWNEVSNWSMEETNSKLMQAKAIFYRCLKDDEVVQESGLYAVNVFKTKLELAKQGLSEPHGE